MSSFISKTDYDSHIREYRLDQITEVNDELLNKAEKRAISVVKSYLNARFDNDTIFVQTGDNRHPAILGVSIDIAMYYLWRLINPRKVPEYVKEAYQEAIDWLVGVQQGEIVPENLPLPDDGSRPTFLWGSNKKRENHL